MTELRSFELGIGMVDPWTQYDGLNTSYYHGNQIGTTRFMTDSGGQQVAPAVYTAFGERVSGTMTGPGDRYGYAGVWGYQTDEDFPFLHVGHRYYDPSTGRFLQRDPIGIRGGLNVYAYLASNPTGAVDPSGLDIIDIVLEPVIGVIGPGNVLEATGGEGHVPVLDPGTAQELVQRTAEVVSICAPVGAAYKTVTASAKTVRALKGSRIGRTIQRLRKYIRKDPPHHGKPAHWDGKFLGG